ncbi:MAG: right-handed parallel beta-helix repeat-containing protein, partial [Planctomycetota bacterium]
SGNADYGGGMYNDNASPTVTNCTFSGNYAGYLGGGMYNRNNSSPTVTNCTFNDNRAGFIGGGMYNGGGSPTVTNCTFTGNRAWDNGGGMRNNNANPTVTDCTFTGNGANRGGGMDNYSNSPTVTNCTFSDNSGWWGGGMNNVEGYPIVNNCTFTGNTGKYGGGMNNYSNSPTVTNCTFSGNTSLEEGGGGMRNNNANPTVTNCTFSGNTSLEEGGGGMRNYNSSPTLTNCILWGDSPDEIFDDVTSSTTVTYSDVQGGTGETWFGEGCIDTDPMFADADGRLLAFSPCLDAGNDAAVPPGVTTDLDGNPRIQGVCVDMGAFESDLNYMDPGWVFMIPDAPDFGYSLNEADLLYFYSFDFVQSLNLTTGGWSIHMPAGLVYIDWPFYYESDTGILWFALPPESGIGVYHFSTSQWEVLPQIIP